MFAVFILTTVLAQTAPNCYKLPSDSLCGPAFEGYPINKPIEEFKNNLQWYIASLQNLTVQMVESGACINSVGAMVGDFRYMLTAQCVYNIQKAIKDGCPVESFLRQTGPLMCENQCQIALNSVSKVMENREICTKDLTTPREYRETCQSTADAVAKDDCVAAVPSELDTCGIAQEKCSSLTDESCCAELTLAYKINSNSSISTLTIILLIVAFLILVAGFVFYFMRTRSIEAKIDQAINRSVDNSNEKKASSNSEDNLVTKHMAETSTYSLSRSKDRDFKVNTIELLPSTTTKPSVLTSIIVDVDDELIIPKEARKAIVRHQYVAEQSDELSLEVGDVLIVLNEFNDGWGVGLNKEGKEGAFPLVCLEIDAGLETKLHQRASSLIKLLKSPRKKVDYDFYLSQLE